MNFLIKIVHNILQLYGVVGVVQPFRFYLIYVVLKMKLNSLSKILYEHMMIYHAFGFQEEESHISF